MLDDFILRGENPIGLFFFLKNNSAYDLFRVVFSWNVIFGIVFAVAIPIRICSLYSV